MVEHGQCSPGLLPLKDFRRVALIRAHFLAAEFRSGFIQFRLQLNALAIRLLEF